LGRGLVLVLHAVFFVFCDEFWGSADVQSFSADDFSRPWRYRFFWSCFSKMFCLKTPLHPSAERRWTGFSFLKWRNFLNEGGVLIPFKPSSSCSKPTHYFQQLNLSRVNFLVFFPNSAYLIMPFPPFSPCCIMFFEVYCLYISSTHPVLMLPLGLKPLLYPLDIFLVAQPYLGLKFLILSPRSGIPFHVSIKGLFLVCSF